MSLSRHGSATPPPSGRSPSPFFTPVAGGEQDPYDSSYDAEVYSVEPIGDYELESVSCQWLDCRRPFSELQALINHIHDDHIGMNKSNYTCEWSTCPRRGIQQASRFALISHIRAHTGEKPFTCPLPECDKSFTRSDAMAKHMRLQHNMSPPAPGRGGSRKRKRDEEAETEGTPALKVEGNSPTDLSAGVMWGDEERIGTTPQDERSEYLNPSGNPRGRSPGALSSTSDEEREDALPEHLLQHKDPATGKIFGRSPAMVRYLVMKAKHRFALEQHESLLEELRVVRAEELRARELKEQALDEMIRIQLGPQAEFLIQQPQMPLMYGTPQETSSYPSRMNGS
ncbi:hypothetical protein ACEPAG_2840 [Sanghuangporus baumii]